MKSNPHPAWLSLFRSAWLACIAVLFGCATPEHREVRGDGRRLITLSVTSLVSGKEMRGQAKRWYASYPENPEFERRINTTLKDAGYDITPEDGIGWHMEIIGAGDVREILATIQPRGVGAESSANNGHSGIVDRAVTVGVASALTKVLPGVEDIFWVVRRHPSTTVDRQLPIGPDALRYMPPDGRRYLWTRVRNPSRIAFQDCLTVAYSDFSDDELRNYNAACIANAIGMPSITKSVSKDYWIEQRNRRKYFIMGDIYPATELPVARLTNLDGEERPLGSGPSRTTFAKATVKMYEGGQVVSSDSALLLSDLKQNDWVLVAERSLIGFVLGPDEDQ